MGLSQNRVTREEFVSTKGALKKDTHTHTHTPLPMRFHNYSCMSGASLLAYNVRRTQTPFSPPFEGYKDQVGYPAKEPTKGAASLRGPNSPAPKLICDMELACL